MDSIPLVRARYANNFVAALNQHGVPVEKYLLRAHLPLEFLEYADGKISAHSLGKFAGDAALDTGIFDIGLLAGTTPVATHGDFGTHVVHAPSLHSAIQVFCDEARAEYSKADFYLAYDGPTTWFCRGPIDRTAEQQQQIELYLLMLMLQTIRLALGPDWRPASMHLKYTQARDLADNDFLLDMNIEFGAQATAIAISLLSLVTPMPGTESNTICAKGSSNPDSLSELPPTELLSTLRHLLCGYVRHAKHPTVEIAAEMAGAATHPAALSSTEGYDVYRADRPGAL